MTQKRYEWLLYSNCILFLMSIQLKAVMDLELLNFESFSVFLRPVVKLNWFLFC